MNEFDKNIINISNNISKNIATLTEMERGFVSQNVLNNLRNLVEAVDQRIFSEKETIELNKFDDIERSVAYVASHGELRFLSRFHYFLQASVSHFIPDEDGAVRLMLKYYEWLIRIRDYVKERFGLEILYNLEDYPLDLDDSLKEYYEKIANQLNSIIYPRQYANNRYYIQKSKSFFVDGHVYYELSIVPADDYSSKYNRFIAFSNREIPTFYAIKLSFVDGEIEIIGRKMPIRVINSFLVSIRPVEFDDLSKILGMRKVGSSTIEYNAMMKYLTETGMSISELVNSEDDYYSFIKASIQAKSQSNNLFNSLDLCRNLIKNSMPGSNVLSYLLLRMRHGIMKYQIADRSNNWLSYLHLFNECLPFDEMPFDASLVFHNPSLYDVFSCINCKDREHELLSRRIRINTEQSVQLFTPKKDVEYIGNLVELSEKFNSLLIKKHYPIRKLVVEKNNVYINGYVADTVEIIKSLISRSGNGLMGFENSVSTWLQNSPEVDSDEKKEILTNLFSKHDLALIYGAAGTGKTTLIKHISSFFANANKLYLANTNPAVENLRRKVNVKNCHFSTIAGIGLLANENYGVIFIDECSTVDNAAMRELLGKLKCRLLVLVGDIYQIRSIKFGNWFSLARFFLNSEMIYELNSPYRSKKSDLLELWNKVRLLDERTEEYIAIKDYATELDESVFEREDPDEVILCLNYDGLYGINNVNRFLQNDNQNPAVIWDSWVYKVEDPVIFNEHNRFFPILYNNLKGWIKNIDKNEGSIQFEVEVDMVLTEFDASLAGFELIDCKPNGHSIIRFSVNNYVEDDIREKQHDQVVPFQIAYAISIHKAQGLEYNSVKVIVTDEVDELITHNIFYTAITRAREKLKIYWSPEAQHKILNNMKLLSCKKDAYIISNKYKLELANDID